MYPIFETNRLEIPNFSFKVAKYILLLLQDTSEHFILYTCMMHSIQFLPQHIASGENVELTEIYNSI